MNAVRPPVAPASTGNVYELRNYRGKPAGGLKQWLDAFTAVLPEREKYSKIVGLWTTEAGQPNEACHIWAYPSLNARAEARGNAMKDPAWQEFLGKGPGFLEEMHSTIMLPAPHSPLQYRERTSLSASGLRVTRPSDSSSRVCPARSAAARGASPWRRAAA